MTRVAVVNRKRERVNMWPRAKPFGVVHLAEPIVVGRVIGDF